MHAFIAHGVLSAAFPAQPRREPTCWKRATRLESSSSLWHSVTLMGLGLMWAWASGCSVQQVSGTTRPGPPARSASHRDSAQSVGPDTPQHCSCNGEPRHWMLTMGGRRESVTTYGAATVH